MTKTQLMLYMGTFMPYLLIPTTCIGKILPLLCIIMDNGGKSVAYISGWVKDYPVEGGSNV
jgi:hypothetical protein